MRSFTEYHDERLEEGVFDDLMTRAKTWWGGSRDNSPEDWQRQQDAQVRDRPAPQPYQAGDFEDRNLQAAIQKFHQTGEVDQGFFHPSGEDQDPAIRRKAISRRLALRSAMDHQRQLQWAEWSPKRVAQMRSRLKERIFQVIGDHNRATIGNEELLAELGRDPEVSEFFNLVRTEPRMESNLRGVLTRWMNQARKQYTPGLTVLRPEEGGEEQPAQRFRTIG